MGTKVKVCGVTRPQDAELACRLGAWAVGMIFVPKSPRNLTRSQALEIRKAIAPGILAVGVFVDSPRQEIEAITADCSLNAVQLHGSEEPSACLGFKIPVFKRVSLGATTDAGLLRLYGAAGYLLEPERTVEDRWKGAVPDARSQRSVWSLAKGLHEAGMIILAGGLNPGNLREAIAAARPDAVDVSSGVESAPGIKDPARLEAFFKAAA